MTYRYPVYLTFLLVCLLAGLTACWLGSETWNGKAKRLGFIEKKGHVGGVMNQSPTRAQGTTNPGFRGTGGHGDEETPVVLWEGKGWGTPLPLLRWTIRHCADQGI